MIHSWAARALLFGPWRVEAATVQYMRNRGTTGQQGAVDEAREAALRHLNAAMSPHYHRVEPSYNTRVGTPGA